MADAGGYEYEFVDVPLDRVVCKICHNPCRDVHLTGCCGAHFCLTCLQQLKKNSAVNRACPMCRVEKFKIFPNKRLDREIKALKVYCINRKSGCVWSGEINDVKKHMNTDCQFVDVFCPSKCGLYLKRQCVQLHLSRECPCHCQYCGVTENKEEISKRHKKHCFHHPIPCPNGCEVGVVPSVGVDAHRQICPLEMAHCEYLNFGCNVRATRRELDEHYKHHVAEHLNLAKCKLGGIIEEMHRTEKKLAMTTKELESTKLKYNKLEGRMSNINKEIIEIKSIQQVHVDETTVVQPTEDCVKRKFFEFRFGRLSMMILCILIMYITHVNITNDRLTQTEEFTWPNTLKKLSTLDSDQVAPITFNIPEYRKKVDNNETWFSPSFFAIKDECKTWLMVKFYKGVGITVSLIFLKDHSEDTCYWTQDTMFMIELLNQLYNSDHYVSPFFTDNGTYCFMKDESRILCTMYFVSDELIEKKSAWYLKNDSVYLRVTHDRNIYNYLFWLIRHITGPEHSSSKYHAYILWLIIAYNLIMELQDISRFSYKIRMQSNGTKFVKLDRIVHKVCSLYLIFGLVYYMLYCIGLFSL